MKGIAAYHQQRIDSAPPEDILILLLEKALQKEAQADEAIAAGDRTAWNAALHHARAIFMELSVSLDHSVAPDVTHNVASLYRWCIHHLTEVSHSGDRARLTEIRDVTASLLDTWSAAVAKTREAE